MNERTPRQRRQAKTRQEILDAALALINEKGPDNFTLRSLARRVDYSPAGLYEYFDSKDDIIDAVCAEGDERLRRYLRTVPSDLPPDDYLVELGMAYVRFSLRNREHFMLMFTHVEEGPLVPYEALKIDKTYQILLGGVQRGIDAGLIATRPGHGLIEIAYGLWAIGHGLATLRLTNLRNVDHDFDAADRAAMEAFVRGLRS